MFLRSCFTDGTKRPAPTASSRVAPRFSNDSSSWLVDALTVDGWPSNCEYVFVDSAGTSPGIIEDGCHKGDAFGGGMGRHSSVGAGTEGELVAPDWPITDATFSNESTAASLDMLSADIDCSKVVVVECSAAAAYET